MFKKIYSKIFEYERIIIHRHTRPDGDALGSQLGLKNAILASFPNKYVKVVGDMNERYSWIGSMDDVSDDEYEKALVIVVDSGASSLISDDRFNKGEYLIKIDHHIPQGEYGDLALVDTSRESCAGIIADFVLNTPLVMTDEVAKYLFIGMVTDSGRFRYSQTNSKTFDIVSKLYEHTIDTEYIYNKLYCEKLETVKLRAKLISKFNITDNGVAYLVNTKEDVLEYGLPIFDISRGMVNIMSGIEGINVWSNFTEDANGDVYAEFRSNGPNVNKVATMFGGGGHLQASGCTLKSLSMVKEVVEQLDNAVKEYIYNE